MPILPSAASSATRADPLSADPPLPGAAVEVAIALIWRGGRLLLTRRPEGVHLAGLWEFPGGKCLPGEAPEACAVRETTEETGLSVRSLGLRPAIVHAYPERTVRLHPVDCEWLCGEPEAAELAWVLPSELAGYPLPAANGPLVAMLAADSPQPQGT